MNNLQHARKLKHLGLRETARELGISAAHLCDIEHSRRSPSDGLRRKIEEMFGDVGFSEEQAVALVENLYPVFRKEDKESIVRLILASEKRKKR